MLKKKNLIVCVYMYTYIIHIYIVLYYMCIYIYVCISSYLQKGNVILVNFFSVFIFYVFVFFFLE